MTYFPDRLARLAAPDIAPFAALNAEWTYDPFAEARDAVMDAGRATISAMTDIYGLKLEWIRGFDEGTCLPY